MPEAIQRQLSDAITIIGTSILVAIVTMLNDVYFSGHEDFPLKWEGLLQEMVDHFKSGDFYQINGVLRTAHSLTKRYRHEFKSQELWSEIKLVLDSFSQPFTQLFETTMDLMSRHAENAQALKVSQQFKFLPMMYHAVDSDF